MRNQSFTPDLASYLLQDGLLTPGLLSEIHSICQQQKISLITHLVRENIISSDVILACCAKYFSLPIFDLSDHIPEENLLPIEFMLRYRILPLSRDQHIMQIGISDPAIKLPFPPFVFILTFNFHARLRKQTR